MKIRVMEKYYIVSLLYIYLCCVKTLSTYTIYTLEDPNVCNQTIYLEQEPNSAVILKLTARESYPFSPLYCTISFKAPIHKWSGLTGILEEIDLRRYQDTEHHLGQSVCVDYIKILTDKTNSIPNEKQCGTWSINPSQPLSDLGYNRALVGYCRHRKILENAEKCHASEIKVIVSIGTAEQEAWKDLAWSPHRGFTFVVTAYSYPIKNGESECRDGLRSCKQDNTPMAALGNFHCIHDSLWCDGHINCGFLANVDEIACSKKGVWSEIVTVVIGPWMGISMFLIFVFCGVFYWRSSKIRLKREIQRSSQEINSYAESYELSSNLSSAHHMAIQVRVVCNANHGHHGTRTHQPRNNDLPPSYETLFPQGPPQACSPIASIIATVAQGASGSTAFGVNVSSMMTVPSTVVTSSRMNTSSNTQHCQAPTSAGSSACNQDLKFPTDITSIIDLNVTSNNFQPPLIAKFVDSSDSDSNQHCQASTSATSGVNAANTDVLKTPTEGSSIIGLNVTSNNVQQTPISRSSGTMSIPNIDTTMTPTNTQTRVILTLTPNSHVEANKSQCNSVQGDDIFTHPNGDNVDLAEVSTASVVNDEDLTLVRNESSPSETIKDYSDTSEHSHKTNN